MMVDGSSSKKPPVPSSSSAKDGAPLADDLLVRRLREILASSDLEKTTGKTIRKQLEAELGRDLSAHKPTIKAEIERYLQGEAIRQSQEAALTHLAFTQSEQGTPPAKPKKKASRGGYGSLLSPELSAFLGGAH